MFGNLSGPGMIVLIAVAVIVLAAVVAILIAKAVRSSKSNGSTREEGLRRAYDAGKAAGENQH